MKKENALSAEKRHLKEQKELASLERKSAASTTFLKYVGLALVILTVVYIADEIASNLYDKMKPYMIFDLCNIGSFSTADPEYEGAISKMAIATIPTYILTFLLPLYKMLPDKFGRKPFLVINTLGMGLGMLLCMIAGNIYWYVIGTVVTTFFTPNDIQVIYIMEVAPQKHRAKFCSITKGIALMSVSLIGVLRSTFYSEANPESWRMVFLIPVLVTLVIGVSCILLTHETPAYIKQRTDYLKKTDEERASDEANRKAEATGFLPAWRYITHSKQLKWVLIVMCIFEVAVGIKGYENETLIAFGHLENINLFLIIEPLVYAIYAFFSGFLSDWMGRKNSCLLFAVTCILGQLAFILLARNGAGIVAISIANGIFYGGLWSFSDCLFFVIPAESTPTHIRSSVTGVITYTGGIQMIVSMILGVMFSKIGSQNVSLLQLFTFIPILVIATILFAINIKETKDVDITDVEKANL